MDMLEFMYQHPDLFLFDNQIIEDGPWIFYLLRCGRSFGKTYAGSAWVAKKIRGGARIIGLCGPTYDDVAKVMVPAILSWCMPHELEEIPYNAQNHTIKFKNGAKIYCYTSDKEIRGPNLEYLWCDEICAWSEGQADKIKERFEDIARAVRVGKHPQIIITSTPKPHPFFFDFQEEIDKNNPYYKMKIGTMFDNPTLPQSYIDKELSKYGNTPRGRQELYGDLIFENPEALFKREWIDDHRIFDPRNHKHIRDIDIVFFWTKVLNQEIFIKRCAIAVDPSGSSKKTSDETGIIVCLQDMKNEVYIIQDESGQHTPDAWARRVRDLFFFYDKKIPTCIVAETNFGGDLVISNLLAADHKLKPFIKEIKASKSKLLRAETSASKYQRGKIHHIGFFDKLERQMCNYIGTHDANLTGARSPDRMDALVHGINELVVVEQYAKRDLRILEGY
jgi:phage terminase large subunit-like protein